jgi:hypothetical protein
MGTPSIGHLQQKEPELANAISGQRYRAQNHAERLTRLL